MLGFVAGLPLPSILGLTNVGFLTELANYHLEQSIGTATRKFPNLVPQTRSGLEPLYIESWCWDWDQELILISPIINFPFKIGHISGLFHLIDFLDE